MSTSGSVLTALRREILQIAFATREGHIASSFSVLEILWVLYDKVLRHDSGNPQLETRDRLVVSKGHCALGLYAVLAEKGFFHKEELQTFCAPGSRLEGHPNISIPGVEVSTGSLGNGIAMAVGIALALRLKGSTARVFCIIGDGEASEGLVWESAILAAHYKLSNFFLIVDANNSSPVKFTMADKLNAFGFSPRNVDGHNQEQLLHAFRAADFDAPTAIIAHTVKGKGCEPLEKNPEMWHHKSPASQDELETLMAVCK